MKMKYINEIKANISIYASKKTSNLLDGSYQSIYKGKSLNFEDLREYVVGDNIKDIDWKSSARNNTLLIKQYVAEKKHNILLLFDTGEKMEAYANNEETKKELALLAGGTIAYLAYKNRDYVSSLFIDHQIHYFREKNDLYYIERMLSDYDSSLNNANYDLNKSLDYLFHYIKKRMIVFVITDLDGIEKINRNLLKKISCYHDLLFINISDISITNSNIFDIEDGNYVPYIFENDEQLKQIEQQLKQEKQEFYTQEYKKYHISSITITNKQEIPNKMIQLLKEHRYAKIY